MKNSVVKKSIFSRFLNMMLPFYCRGCGKAGSLLCERCRNDIEVVGEVPVLPELDRLFVAGLREGALSKLVEDYKFKSLKGISEILVDLLDEAVPGGLPGKIVVVPLPTIRKHIRERGFDHTWRLAGEFSRRRNWAVAPILKRVNKTVQVGADEATRKKQAERAYAVNMEVAKEVGLMEKFGGSKKKERLSEDVGYLLLDDVWTTGASMRAAAKKLRESGAKRIYGAVVCINCLD